MWVNLPAAEDYHFGHLLDMKTNAELQKVFARREQENRN